MLFMVVQYYRQEAPNTKLVHYATVHSATSSSSTAAPSITCAAANTHFAEQEVFVVVEHQFLQIDAKETQLIRTRGEGQLQAWTATRRTQMAVAQLSN
jgi:hypothetical protein